jgi:peptide chain release factor 2
MKTSSDGFWNDKSTANNILKKIKKINNTIDFYNELSNQYELLDLYLTENIDNNNVNAESVSELKNFSSLVKDLEIRTLLNNKDDDKNVVLTIHPGAGGKDSQDWAFMLYRMYIKWAESNNYKYSILSYNEGDETGIKDASIQINADYAFGKLQSERGIHRLVRISPFDSNAKRHTSFAAVFIDPLIDDDIDIEISDSDLKIDTYRASGAGGQHVNKTDSAVRITHLDSGITVQCQNQRSQLKNKNIAIKILKSRLYQLKLDEMNDRKNELNLEKKDIAWGSQIRSYVFHPYNLIKDHRTDYETSNIQKVLDGSIDEYIKAYLLFNMEKNNVK